MGRKIHVFIPKEFLNEQVYSIYLHQCLSLNPYLTLLESKRIDLSQPWEAHFCKLSADLNRDPEDYDIDKFFSGDLTLYRNKYPEGYNEQVAGFFWRLQIEVVECLRGEIFGFLMAKNAFACFSGAVIEDENSDDPENVELYADTSEFLQHGIRVLENTYGKEMLCKGDHLDPKRILRI